MARLIIPEAPRVEVPKLLAPAFKRAFKDVLERRDTDPRSPTYGQTLREYWFKGGRGSTKSSFISLMLVLHLVRFPKSNAIVFVKIAENIRDSVYKQIRWAIDHLGLTHLFKCITHPFRCEYLPTGQEILFRGLDKAGKIKGIRPTIGVFDQIWFEELTEFESMEECRSVIESVLRGGDEDNQCGDVPTWAFYSYNPPMTMLNWVNQEANRTERGRKVYASNYLTVPSRWLGRDFFERAENLKLANLRAYKHEYLGEVTGTGRNVFNNLEIRTITDEEILERFDNRMFGIDWGFANDPFVWLAMHFDRNHRILYIFDEIRCLGKRTQETAELVRKKMERLGGSLPCWADSAEPDSIADFNAWGVRCEGCPKPHGNKWSGRDYEFKCLQDLNKIVIDKVYCKGTAEELQKLEYPRNRNGDTISQYPHTDGGDACLRGNTIVLTEDGPATIESLVGTTGRLMTYCESTRSFFLAKYRHCRKTRENAQMVRVVLADGATVDCTPDHRLLTVTGGWKEAGDLKPYDFVVTRKSLFLGKANAMIPIRAVDISPLRGREDVYDLEVVGTHNFVVNGRIVVHNCRYGTFYALREAGLLTI